MVRMDAIEGFTQGKGALDEKQNHKVMAERSKKQRVEKITYSGQLTIRTVLLETMTKNRSCGGLIILL